MRTSAVRVLESTLGGTLLTLPTKPRSGIRRHVDLNRLTLREPPHLGFVGADRQLHLWRNERDDRRGWTHQRAGSLESVLDASVDGRYHGRFSKRQAGLRHLGVGLVDRGLRRRQVLVGIRMRGLVEHGLRLRNRLRLLAQVEAGIWLLRLLQLEPGLLHGRALGADIVIGGGRLGQRQLLGGLIDARLRLLQVFFGCAVEQLLEPRLVRLQPFARGRDLRLNLFDLGVLYAAGNRREFGLRGLQVVLDGDELALRLLLLGQELRALSVDATTHQRLQPRVGGLHLCIRGIEGGLQLSLLGGRTAASEQVELRLRRVDPRVAGLHRGAGGGFGGAARGAVGVDFRSSWEKHR